MAEIRWTTTAPTGRVSRMTDHARRFHDLHQQGSFVLPNAWDAASAAVIAAAGAVAIATTSSGVSWALGVPDGERLGREETVPPAARLARVLHLPVTADVDPGYGPPPADVAATVEAVIDAGAVGVTLEDPPATGDEPLRGIDDQCERIAAARAAADRSGAPFVINARTDVFLYAVGDPADREDVAIARGERYAEAGGDCLFVPGVVDAAVIERLVARSPLPLNILLGAGRGPSPGELGRLGVRRISVGGALAGVAHRATRQATEELLAGTDEALRTAIPHAEMEALLTRGEASGRGS